MDYASHTGSQPTPCLRCGGYGAVSVMPSGPGAWTAIPCPDCVPAVQPPIGSQPAPERVGVSWPESFVIDIPAERCPDLHLTIDGTTHTLRSPGFTFRFTVAPDDPADGLVDCHCCDGIGLLIHSPDHPIDCGEHPTCGYCDGSGRIHPDRRLGS